MKQFVWFYLLIFGLFFNSCITNKDLVYLQDKGTTVDNSAQIQSLSTPYRVQVNDILSINIKSSDSELKKLVEIFQPTEQASGLLNNQSLYFSGFTVDLHGNIEFPILDKINVLGFTTDEIETKVNTDLITLLEGGVPIKEYTQVYEELTQRVPVQFVGKDFYKYFPFSRSNQNKMYLFFHRFFDILISVIGIILGLVFVPFVFLGNLIANKGPMFYIQERIGKNGNLFNIIKYRTMITNAEKNGAVWAKKTDTRITPFGKFMRNTRIDEIPQFINVLKGDMSLIGPRPERPHFVRELSQILPFYETRHIVKPGLTGWAQVKTRYGSSVDDSLLKLQYDLFYIKHRSFVLDVNILIKTLSTIIFFRGQ